MESTYSSGKTVNERTCVKKGEEHEIRIKIGFQIAMIAIGSNRVSRASSKII
jgi:hypothetical protein